MVSRHISETRPGISKTPIRFDLQEGSMRYLLLVTLGLLLFPAMGEAQEGEEQPRGEGYVFFAPGKGYPGGLKGDQIPLGARIVTVVDSFDAMVSDRCYRKGMSLEIALDRLMRDSGKQFDPEIVEPFVRMAEVDLPQIAQIREPDPESAFRRGEPA